MNKTNKLFSFWSAMCVCLLLSLPLQAQVPAIPNAKLVELQGVGQIPHIAATSRFHEALL